MAVEILEMLNLPAVTASTIRTWADRGKVRKYGLDTYGLQKYELPAGPTGMTPHGALIKDLRRWKADYYSPSPGNFIATINGEDYTWRYDDRNADIRALHTHIADALGHHIDGPGNRRKTVKQAAAAAPTRAEKTAAARQRDNRQLQPLRDAKDTDLNDMAAIARRAVKSAPNVCGYRFTAHALIRLFRWISPGCVVVTTGDTIVTAYGT